MSAPQASGQPHRLIKSTHQLPSSTHAKRLSSGKYALPETPPRSSGTERTCPECRVWNNTQNGTLFYRPHTHSYTRLRTYRPQSENSRKAAEVLRDLPSGDLTQTRRPRRIAAVCGGVAQLGERRVRNAEVEGSIPFLSTTCPVSQARDDCCIDANPAFFVTGVM